MQMYVVDDEVYTFHAFYERYRRPIHSYVFHMLNSQEDANDVTQEVFVRVFKAWDGLRDRENLSTWLYRLATGSGSHCWDLANRRRNAYFACKKAVQGTLSAYRSGPLRFREEQLPIANRYLSFHCRNTCNNASLVSGNTGSCARFRNIPMVKRICSRYC